MRDLLSVAQRLRAVRDASRDFLGRWFVDRVVLTALLDRVADAVARHEPGADDEMTGGKRSRFDDDPPHPKAS